MRRLNLTCSRTRPFRGCSSAIATPHFKQGGRVKKGTALEISIVAETKILSDANRYTAITIVRVSLILMTLPQTAEAVVREQFRGLAK